MTLADNDAAEKTNLDGVVDPPGAAAEADDNKAKQRADRRAGKRPQ